MNSANSTDAVVIDANVLIALCAQEADKYAVAKAAIEQRAQSGSQFFAPGVIVAETLFALCRKLMDGTLTLADHAKAVQSLHVRMTAILPPVNGDGALVERAEFMRGTYGCSRSADGLYLALAETLTQTGSAELITFDIALAAQASVLLPSLTVCLLVPTK